MSKARLRDIDRAKGLAIALVVLGHIGDEHLVGNDWYVHLHLMLYKFHMAFFVFITGYVMFYTYPNMHTFRAYIVYVRRKLSKLMPAFFLVALVMAAGKTAMGQFFPIQNQINGFSGFIKMFLCPHDSYCRSLWYIYVLSIYYLSVPLLLKLFKQNFEALLIFAFALYFLPRYEYFAQRQVVEYLFVFLLGGYALCHRDSYLDGLDKYRWVFMSVFAALILLYFVIDIPKLVFGLAAIPTLHSLARSRFSERIYILSLLGKYVFPIYLINSIVIGGLLAMLQRWWSLDGMVFRVAAPLLFMSGLLIPIVAYELFIKRIPVLKTIIQA